jgi:transcriptional regulator with XRE-family HTH domain
MFLHKNEKEGNRRIRENVRRIRLDKSVTQEDLALRIGKSQKNFSDIERGRTELSACDLMEIAAKLDTPIRYFLPVNVPEGEISEEEWEVLSDYRRMWRVENQSLARTLLKEIADHETEEDLAKQKREMQAESAKKKMLGKSKK